MREVLFGLVLLAAGAVLLAVAILFFVASRAFENASDKVGRATATLRDTKHKKNAVIYGKEHITYGPTKAHHIKDLTKTTYTYMVNGKEYTIRGEALFTTPRQLSRMTSVFYWKPFPKIAYLKDEIESFGIWALVLLFIAGGCILCGILALI